MNPHFNCLICGAMVVLQSIASAAQTATPQPAVSSVPQKQGWPPVDISQISFSLPAEEQIIESLSKDLNMPSQQAEELLKSIEIHQWFGLPSDMGDDSPQPMMMVSFRWKDVHPVSPKLLAVTCILKERELHYAYLPPTTNFIHSFSDIYDKTTVTINEIRQQKQLSNTWYKILSSSRKKPRKISFDTFDADLPWIQTLRLLNNRIRQKCDNTMQYILEVSNKNSPYVAAADFDQNNGSYRLDIVFLPFIR